HVDDDSRRRVARAEQHHPVPEPQLGVLDLPAFVLVDGVPLGAERSLEELDRSARIAVAKGREHGRKLAHGLLLSGRRPNGTPPRARRLGGNCYAAIVPGRRDGVTPARSRKSFVMCAWAEEPP